MICVSPTKLSRLVCSAFWAREQYVDPNGRYLFTAKEVNNGIHLDKMVVEYNKAVNERFYHNEHIGVILHGIEFRGNRVVCTSDEPEVEFYDKVHSQYHRVQLKHYDADVMNKELFFDMVSKEIADLSKMIMYHIFFKFDRVQAETWSRYLLTRCAIKEIDE